MVVVPEINAGTASLVATVINPAIGLGTFLAQMFLRQPLMRAATQEFHIDGTWADPRVTRVDRGPPTAAEGRADPRRSEAACRGTGRADMKVAAIQMVSGVSLQANLADGARACWSRRRRPGAELAVLPEYFCLMGHQDSDKLAARESFGEGAIQRFLAQAARELGLWIVGGTLPLVAGDAAHVRNTCLVFSPAGECVARYDKIHLFRFDNGRERYDESRVIEAGDRHRWRSSCAAATATPGASA